VDALKNFAYGTVLTAPSPATSGTSLVLGSGQGALFPQPTTDGPFNVLLWPTGAQPTAANAEIVRCTARATDTLTIVRAQEASSARTVVVGDQVCLGITKGMMLDVASAEADARSGSASPTIRETFPRWGLGTAGVISQTTGVMYAVAIVLYEGDVISKICFPCAGAANTPTNWWYALYDTQAVPALLRQTADQLTAAIAVGSPDVALSSPYTVPKTGVYYIAYMVKATTVPTRWGLATGMAGTSMLSPLTGMPYQSCTSGSALTGTAPATIASPTGQGNIAYGIAH
jgi:hypothetical protein